MVYDDSSSKKKVAIKIQTQERNSCHRYFL